MTAPQLNLFADIEARRAPQRGLLADTPRARGTDPITSHEAAEALKASGELGRQQREVLAALQRWPGSTSLELAGRMGVSRQVTGRRLPELAPVYVRQGDPARGEYRLINGRRHVQWWPVKSTD